MECIHDTNAYFILQGKSYIMGQAIERTWKQNKDKESHGANPPRSALDLKAKWHSLRSSVLRYLKKQKEEENIQIKWPFWEDLKRIVWFGRRKK